MPDSSGGIKRFHIAIMMDSLTQETAYDDISVTLICKKSNISRATFYRLFDDKYSIATWYQDLVISVGVEEIGRSRTWRDGFLVSISGVEILHSLLESASECQGYVSTRETAFRRHRDDFLKTISDFKHVKITDELAFQVDFVSRGITETMHHWVTDVSHLDAETQADFMESCVPKRLHDLLKNPNNPKPMEKLDLASLAILAGR